MRSPGQPQAIAWSNAGLPSISREQTPAIFEPKHIFVPRKHWEISGYDISSKPESVNEYRAIWIHAQLLI